MTGRYKLPRAALSLTLLVGLTFAAPALADSVAAEEAQGAQVLSQIQQGALSAKRLTTTQYQNLGEYLMGRALGSTQLHQRMNRQMDEMMGPNGADLMHIYLGKRYLGIPATPSSRYSQVYGLMGVMMSGYRGSELAGMMAGYVNGRGTAGYPMGPGMMGYGQRYGYTQAGSSGGGWPTGAVVAVVALGALLIAGLAALALPRIRKRRHSGPAATA